MPTRKIGLRLSKSNGTTCEVRWRIRARTHEVQHRDEPAEAGDDDERDRRPLRRLIFGSRRETPDDARELARRRRNASVIPVLVLERPNAQAASALPRRRRDGSTLEADHAEDQLDHARRADDAGVEDERAMLELRCQLRCARVDAL